MSIVQLTIIYCKINKNIFSDVVECKEIIHLELIKHAFDCLTCRKVCNRIDHLEIQQWLTGEPIFNWEFNVSSKIYSELYGICVVHEFEHFKENNSCTLFKIIITCQ